MENFFATDSKNFNFNFNSATFVQIFLFKMTSSKIIRQQFLDFFASKQHLIVESAPMVLRNDPTLMFTNAGMNQFKDYFLGNGVPKSKRIADTQKCLRVTGKHNDLEDVGHDTYHHTMFEMLGNWSFGDYFKKEAITWAWELLTEVYKLPKDRLYVTIFEGDAEEGLDFDQEAYDIWASLVDASKILKGNKKDNFWEMGDQGPCGPCSEIHIDLRPQEEVDIVSGALRVNNDDPQVIEIWNNVFMQYNRKADGSLELLPDKHVDTGMGFERLVRVIQGKYSNYDTDLFRPLIHQLELLTGYTYTEGKDGFSKTDIAMRVIVDHLRAVSFAIADGQLPSNAKAGYVIRRILRRAVRYGYTFLGIREPFMYKLIPHLAEILDVFSELRAQLPFVSNVIKEEEASFLRTLENGIRLLDNELHNLKGKNEDVISGKIAFELYDTYGFPLDLTHLIARENGLRLDEAGFHAEMEAQKQRSRNASVQDKSDWIQVGTPTETVFVGYDQYTATSSLIKYRKVVAKEGQYFQLVLDKTPFYAESGGQIGDTGVLMIQDTPLQINIHQTKKENDLIIHITFDEAEEILEAITSQSVLWAKVDVERRIQAASNHSATHLLQSALKQVLGNHIQQKGSYVSPELLRFDFSHFGKMSHAEISKVEKIVNNKIRTLIALDERRNVPIQEALNMGATALFGEKYGDLVRVICFDPQYSIELCGGTHVHNTGEIGWFKIISEGSVAAGVRRIEALTGSKAQEYLDTKIMELEEISALLKHPKDTKKAIEQLLEERTRLLRKVEQYEKASIKEITKVQRGKIKEVNGVNFVASTLDVSSADAVKTVAFELKNQVSNLFGVFVAEVDSKPHISVVISESIVESRKMNASQIVRELAKDIQGGGGGQAFYASAGGKDASGLHKVLEKATTYLN